MMYLRPEADRIGYGLHGIGVAANVEAAEEHALKVVALSVQICQVADVV